jgi:membrane protein YdbS with pleckstrin-like domain
MWAAVHIYSGVVGLASIVMHIIWHWDWLKALRGRPFSEMPKKLRANRVVDRIMWITFIATNVFGAMAWALHFGDDVYVVSVPDRLHVVFGVAWTIIAIVHLVLHGKWITSTSQRYIALGLGRSIP